MNSKYLTIYQGNDANNEHSLQATKAMTTTRATIPNNIGHDGLFCYRS